MNYKSVSYFFVALFITSCLIFSQRAHAQYVPTHSMSASEIKLSLKKMQVVGSALYVAAHPDDENTRMITYLSNDVGVETAYLALTRGDGGQNLIGKEVREQMGLIRTQELLAARRIDGGKQFFSRANDFGYSKHPDETLQIWDKQKVLADVVWTIRKFRPDVIITRFSPYRDGKTHGHHTTSAKLALEAFKLSGDPKAFPEQLKHYEPWQAKRILWNTSWWFFRSQKNYDFSQLMDLDVGTFNPFLGKSHGEIAATSRSMHKSQGFGASKQRGEEIEYLKHLAGDSSATTLFEDIDLTWDRIPNSGNVQSLLVQAYQGFKMENPAAILPTLLEARAALKKLPQDRHYIRIKLQQIDRIIAQCAGLWWEATAQNPSIALGDSLYIETRIIKRGGVPVTIEEIEYPFATHKADSLLPDNVIAQGKQGFILPKDYAISQPYWLRKTPKKGMFVVEDQTLIGKPENEPPLSVAFSVSFGGDYPATIQLETPVLYRTVDPVEGERYQPVAITPPVVANISEQVYIYAASNPKPMDVLLKSMSDEELEGTLRLEAPKGWEVTPKSMPFHLKEKYEELPVSFEIAPPQGQSVGKVEVVIETPEGSFDRGIAKIDYSHIPLQTLFPVAKPKVAKLDIKRKAEKIGYIMGAGDAVPEALQQIGYQVTLLSDGDITPENLRHFDAIIMGVRAYNTVDRLKFHQEKLMNYVKEGGNMIVQYNTSFRLVTEEIAPYPLKLSRKRVTVEEAPVKFLDKKHPVLNYPNKITQADFKGWVQERGLYFPEEWDEKYQPILEMNDPEEDPLQGSLLVAEYGDGAFIYTGLSFFRELPAGVPGAYRLLVNLIEYGKPTLEVQNAK